MIFPDARRRTLVVEHYRNDGVLDHVIEGRIPTELYATAIQLGLVTRLDHAAYLGQELARAHHALRTGHPFVQDAAAGEEPGPPPAPTRPPPDTPEARPQPPGRRPRARAPPPCHCPNPDNS